jgi:hypothetical protein
MPASTSSGRDFLIFKPRPHAGHRFVPQSSVQLSCRITANFDSVLQIYSDSTVVTKTAISAGPHLLRLVFDSGDVNFNYIDFKLKV